MNEPPACPLVLVFLEAAGSPPSVVLLNDSEKTAVSVTFLAGTIYYGGGGDRRRRVRDLPPRSFVRLDISDFWEPGPQASRLVEVVWSDGSAERDVPIPVRRNVPSEALAAVEVQRDIEFLDPEKERPGDF